MTDPTIHNSAFARKLLDRWLGGESFTVIGRSLDTNPVRIQKAVQAVIRELLAENARLNALLDSEEEKTD
jgi:hypothetical protein